MNRRAELSLSSGKSMNKKQAPGFDSVVFGEADTGAKGREQKFERSIPREQEGEGREVVSRNTVTTWSSGRLLAKVALVVVVSAISLYLLRRRFF